MIRTCPEMTACGYLVTSDQRWEVFSLEEAMIAASVARSWAQNYLEQC